MSGKDMDKGVVAQVARVWAFGRRKLGRWLPGRCSCAYCGRTSPYFLPYMGGGWRRLAPGISEALQVVGSDTERYGCPKCGSNDRERHLKLYFDTLGLGRRLQGARILHFAPERLFGAYVAGAGPREHVKADLYPASPDIRKVDMLQMDFADGHFDMVIANHVLEHVADDRQALAEICRVLRPGGLAVLQTPYSETLHHTFEDAGITSPSARAYVYCQDDHVRLYGQDIFGRFASAGFTSRVVRHAEALPGIDAHASGVNPREPLFLFEKTASP